MPQTKRTVNGVLGGLLGLVGLSAVAGVLVTAAVTPAIAVAGVTGSQALSLFEELPNSLKVGQPMEPTVFYATDENGNEFELAKFYDQNRVPVTFEQVSPLLYDAILSSEDKNFYAHGGVNLGATIKAVIDNVRGTSSRGASTISQQFVKNVLIQECEKEASPSEENYQEKLRACWTEATNAVGSEGIERKLQEMRYAIQIEKDYAKNDILLGYLNIANFGGQTYGIEAAANYYFSTTAKDLTLTQAATLAGIVQNPNRYRIDRPGGTGQDAQGNPTNGEADGWEATKTRRDYVIKRMWVDGKITETQRDAAYAEPITPQINPTPQGCTAANDQAYFCQYVRSIIENDKAFGETLQERWETLRRGGLEVHTSLDMRVQKAGVEAMRERAPQYIEGLDFAASAVTIQADTGRVLAIVQNTKFNETTSADKSKGEIGQVYAADRDHSGGQGFPPGSAYKVFTLIDWLEKGHSVNEVLDGRLQVFKKFTKCGQTHVNAAEIANFARDRGRVSTVMDFTRTSLNTGYLAMASKLDLCDINKVAVRMGVHYGAGKDKPVTEPVDDNDAPNDPYPTVLGSKFIAPIQMASVYATIANKGVFCTPKAIDRVIGPDGKEMPLPKSSCSQVISPEVAATAAHALQGVMNGGTGRQANPYDGTPVIGKTGTHQEYSTAMAISSTKAATFVYVGKASGPNFTLSRTYHNGWSLNNIRFPLARSMQHAANQAYGGDRFPEPDRNLTRPVLKNLPDVVGKSVDEARRIVEDAGFSVLVGEPVASTIDAGLVAEQDPGAGRVASGTTVTLRPSTGQPETVDVPNVVGQKFPQGKKALEDAGFSVGGECKGGAAIAEQDPAAGASVAPGSTVTVACKEDD